MIGHSIYDFMPAGEVEARRDRIEREYATRAENVPREMTFARADGQEILVESVAMPIDYHGKSARMSVLRDLTERRVAEDQLRATETQYRSVVAALEGGIVVQDNAGQITAMNVSAERIFGFSFADIEGQVGVDPRRSLAPLTAPIAAMYHTAVAHGRRQRLRGPIQCISWRRA